ncbi:MAG TPA: endonuclease III [Acidimicrobiia bacterium]|nr:endonuclease III [Acidimicrobiia bacterium]
MSAGAPSSTPDPATRRRARTILGRLEKQHPAIGTALDHDDPWQLLVATVLSAQTTDENVNRVTPIVFERWPTAADLADADPEEVEEVVYSTGFYRQKTKAIIGLSGDLVERFDGEVPDDLDRLVTLQGVGRKTASVVLAEAWGKPAIAVDTHVKRVTRRLGLTDQTDPVKVERDLRALYPEERWAGISMRVIQFGRDTCIARNPRCWDCIVMDICPYPDKTPPPTDS